MMQAGKEGLGDYLKRRRLEDRGYGELPSLQMIQQRYLYTGSRRLARCAAFLQRRKRKETHTFGAAATARSHLFNCRFAALSACAAFDLELQYRAKGVASANGPEDIENGVVRVHCYLSQCISLRVKNVNILTTTLKPFKRRTA